MEIMHRATESAYDEDNGKVESVTCGPNRQLAHMSLTELQVQLRHRSRVPPPRAPGPAKDTTGHIKLIKQWMNQKHAFLAASRSTHTIIPDRTPQSVNDAFVDKLPRLVPILEKDSVRLFLNLFKHETRGLAWGFVITPDTFNEMIVQNALRCAKVALEGKAPELNGHRANPNYVNSSGYFPLHLAAEMFSADMIKLLFRYGASANLRTTGPEVTVGLLPLHVAVENACRHKFLEENPLPDKENTDYVYRLIQLLCLPEMKIFLDAVRLIAERTDDLLAELWKYIKDGKLAETAVLLLAAQKKIRTGSSFKENGNSKTDGFSIISNSCTEDAVAIDSQITQNRVRKKQQLKADKKLRRMALLLVIVICEAGEALDAYIRAHPEVPYAMQVAHDEVLKCVSSILNNHGFCPTGECINIENLCPYDQQSSCLSDKMLPNKHDEYATDEKGVTLKLNTWRIHGKYPVTRDVFFNVLALALCNDQQSSFDIFLAARKKQPRGWELEHARRSFVPHWKAVLFSQLEARACPSPTIELKTIREMDEILNKAAEEGPSPIPHSNLGLSGRIPRLTSNHQSRRLFGTAASTVLKLLKHAT